ncbi:MAG TPA: tRNA (N6-isopentenyl adenosine(37)-C2)-methylthiotransferase MiaB, partial [Clostridia bacterium]|nr:tRNA (N6-isopentenyl adenosine(37)-C2)-methylthiotransferase MiaB [Clostridia bacterium]
MPKDRTEVEVDAAILDKQREYQNKILLINRALYRQNSRAQKAMVATYGCQQNESDSEKIRGMLCNMGYELTDSAEN